MTEPVQWRVCDVLGTDDFAILPNNGSNGLYVGNWFELGQLYIALRDVMEYHQVVSETIAPDHEQLGHEQLSVPQASFAYHIPGSTLRSACEDGRIRHAKKNGKGEWRFSQMAFNSWYAKHKQETRGKRHT